MQKVTQQQKKELEMMRNEAAELQNKERRLYSLPVWKKHADGWRINYHHSSVRSTGDLTLLKFRRAASLGSDTDMSEQIQQRDMRMRELEAALQATQATLVQTQVKSMNAEGKCRPEVCKEIGQGMTKG